MIEKWKYQYWLSCIKGVGNKKRKKLVEYCGSAKEVYALTKKQLMSIPKINEKEAEAVVFSRLNLDLEKEADILNQTGIKMLTIEEAEFPKRLLQLSDCPYAIFYKGNIPPNKKERLRLWEQECVHLMEKQPALRWEKRWLRRELVL